MKKIFTTLLCVSLCLISFSQELANFSRSGAIVSPEIGKNEVTFRISAPYAYTVKLSGSWTQGTIDMTKDATGVWSVTIPAPAPELYTYSFIVDGLSINDANNIFMQRDGTRYLSVLMIDGALTENYYETAQHHGNLGQVWYESPTLNKTRRLFVYTPYGYDINDTKTKYPVLYLLHGAGGDEDAWSTMGRTCQIMDNLIEKGLAKPMLVVMPNGNPTQIAARTLKIDEVPLANNEPNAYVNSIVNDIVPYIEANYNVDAKPKSRAIAGLSMGAGHTISCTLLNPGFFQYICPLSNGIRITDENAATYEKQFKALKSKGYKLYWIGCGDADFLIESARTLDATMTKYGLKHTFYENDGGHTWSNWRKYLNIFAPMLFK